MESIVMSPESTAAGPDGRVTDDVSYLHTVVVNLFLYGAPHAGDREWVLIDTGIYGSAPFISRAAAHRFGEGARPAAIILTHGHFDHVGAVRELAEQWDAPVYAHPLELPYLTGRSSYPPPDPTVGGGAMAALSFLYPRGPIDLGSRVRALPDDGSVPGMPGWRWIHTPGHAPGHVSLFRDDDRALIAGDAFVTTRQESMLAAVMQPPQMHGPPAYFTPDWEDARRSVERLAALEPEVAATGHGVPLRGEEMREALHALTLDFRHLAMPEHGRYVDRPAVADENGVVWVPPAGHEERNHILLGVGAALVAGALVAGLTRSTRRGRRRARRSRAPRE